MKRNAKSFDWENHKKGEWSVYYITKLTKSKVDFYRHATSIIIPDGGTSVFDEAFASCYELKSIEITDSVVSIGSRVFGFKDLSKLQNVIFNGTKEQGDKIEIGRLNDPLNNAKFTFL